MKALGWFALWRASSDSATRRLALSVGERDAAMRETGTAQIPFRQLGEAPSCEPTNKSQPKQAFSPSAQWNSAENRSDFTEPDAASNAVPIRDAAKRKSSMNLISKNHSSFAVSLENKFESSFTSYQIDYLLNEIDFLQRSPKNIGRVRQFISRFMKTSLLEFLSRHAQQFYWTVTRLCGLAHTHDGRPNTMPPRPQLNSGHIEFAAGPRVLIDMTVTHRSNVKTGIQRVVGEVAKAAIVKGSALPVIIENGRVLSYFKHPDLPDVVEIGAEDRLLLLDASWCFPQEYLPILQEVVRRGGRNIWCIHDIFPLLYPGLFGSAAQRSFRDWLETSLPYYSAVVTVSKSVAEDFATYVLTRKPPHKPSLRLGWFHLGGDFATEAEGSVSRRVADLCENASFFLTVGTLEPRKNHMVGLAAFERLWKANVDACYVIVGKYGWLAGALRDRLLRHPEFGRRLFWFETCNDTDLRSLYRHATALIQSSIAEGFGLPIVEAAHFGTPVIASDIRIFREIGGRSIRYFDPTDAGELANCVEEALVGARVPPSVVALTWTEATEQLLQLVKEETYQYVFDCHPEGIVKFTDFLGDLTAISDPEPAP
jgi:glycosyltransferase involved in cell wall biosynthesis